MLQKISISNKCFRRRILQKKKKAHVFHKNIRQHHFFLLFEQQISILVWFLKDHVTEDWSNDAEIQLFITGINYI